MALEEITSQLIESYTAFIDSLPLFFQSFFNLFFLALLIVIYAVFIWKFHRFIGTRNIFNLNLNKYNTADHPTIAKIVAGSLYLLEYIILLPVIIFFWFAVFTIFLIFLTENLELNTVLTLSVTIIAAIRMCSYLPNYGETIAKEVAKLLPLTLLAVSVVTSDFFDFERIIGQLAEIPEFFSLILNYLFFIVILETILRFFEFVFSFLNLEDEEPRKK